MQRIYLNDNWYFARNYTEDLLNPEADLSELRKVRIPHSVCELSYSNFDAAALRIQTQSDSRRCMARRSFDTDL